MAVFVIAPDDAAAVALKDVEGGPLASGADGVDAPGIDVTPGLEQLVEAAGGDPLEMFMHLDEYVLLWPPEDAPPGLPFVTVERLPRRLVAAVAAARPTAEGAELWADEIGGDPAALLEQSRALVALAGRAPDGRLYAISTLA